MLRFAHAAPSAAICCVWLLATAAIAEDSQSGASTAEAPANTGAEQTAPASETVEQLAKRLRDSIVVIRFSGRGGGDQGLGTGFVVGADGLIATNLHVIGEARPISVQLAGGKRFDVTAVHASDRAADLALVKIDAQGLTALELGDSDTLTDGQPVVALGNPQGLEHSVVAGVVSGRREIDGRSMIQLAIPIEPGNSGGPLLDMHGRVHGILTMKSLVTPNLGFAVAINSLKPLLEKPNPVIMSRWLTIGAIDPRDWTPLFGARWRQRSGRILVEGPGAGFGGRSLCLRQGAPPELPYEVAVEVKLDDEAGAAGLVFAADGGDRHYGFYPSNGHLRLSRFDGPDVNSWSVLHDQPNEHYRPGEWNHLKVRVEADKLLCYVNDRLAVESADTGLTGGRVGLAKFRQTKAEFKNFALGRDLPPAAPPAEVVERIARLTADVPEKGPPPRQLLDSLATDAAAGPGILRDQARRLELQAGQLRRLALEVHRQRVLKALADAVVDKPEDQIDLFHAAMLIAWLDNDELDVESYRDDLDQLAAEVTAALPADADETARLAALNKHLFSELGFHGSRGDYYNRSNSYLNEVLDDREGLPITLSVLYIELARRLGVHVVGVGLPGHFVVRHEPADGNPQVIDVYEGGQILTADQVETIVRDFAGRELRAPDLATVTKPAILVRMLHNLLGIATKGEDREAMLPYLDAILTINPDGHQERWFRAVVRYQTGRNDGARADAQWLLENQAVEVDRAAVEQLLRTIETERPTATP